MVAQVFPLFRGSVREAANDSEDVAAVLERCLIYLAEEARDANLTELYHMITVAALSARSAGREEQA